MACRNVSLALVLCTLLAGCNTYYAARRDLGIDPSDPPPPATAAQPMPMQAALPPAGHGEPPPLPGTVLQTREGVAQANWAAQRAATLTVQDNTPPVGYKPEQQASASPLPVAPAGAAPAAPPKATAAAMPPPAAPGHTAPPPAMAKPPAAAPPPAMPPPPAGLPAGYRPSPSAVDQNPSAGQEAGAPAPMATATAAAGHAAMPAVPAVASMKDGGAAMHHDVWRAHLASYRSEEEAIAGWEVLLKAEPKLYGRFDPQVLWTDIPNRGSYARLTMGEFADRKAAEAACETVRTPRRYCAPLKD
jgi:hypothetical protein